MSDSQESTTVKATFLLPRDVHRALKIEAAERRMSMAEIIVEALNGRIRYLPREMRKP